MHNNHIALLTATYSPDEAANIALNLFEGTRPRLLEDTDFRRGRLLNNARVDMDEYPDAIRDVGAVRADTEWAIEFREDCWTKQCEQRYRNLQLVQRAFESEDISPEDFLGTIHMRGTDVDRYDGDGTVTMDRTMDQVFHTLGQTRGSAVKLYDEHGHGIRNKGTYESQCEAIADGNTDRENYD